MPELFLTSDEIDIECPEILGIAGTFKSFRLAWLFQLSNEFEIERLDELSNYNDDGMHTAYQLKHKDNESLFYLVRNKGGSGYFYKKYKGFDHLLFGMDAEQTLDNNSITLIKGFDGVSLCIKLDTPKNPDKMNFIQLL